MFLSAITSLTPTQTRDSNLIVVSSNLYPDPSVNDVISDKNIVTNIMNNSTGLQRIELNGFAKRHWQTGYYPFAYGWCLGLC